MNYPGGGTLRKEERINNIMMKKVTRYEAVYLVLLFICMTIGNLSLTRWTNLFSVDSFRDILIVVMLIFFVIGTIWGERKSALEHFFSISFLILSYIVNVNVKGIYSNLVLITGLMVVCAVHVDYKKIMLISSIPMAAIFVATLTATKMGILINKNWKTDSNAFDFGYRYNTYPAYTIFFLCLMYMICKETLKWYESLVIVGLQLIMFYYTDTMATIATMIIIIVIWNIYDIFDRFFPRHDSRIWSIAIILPFFFTAISYLVQMMYNENSELWLKLNAITVDRIGLGHRALTRYDHTLFGQKVFWVGVASLRPDLIYNYVDNYYLKYGITFGIVYQLCILTALTYVIWKAVKYKKYVMVLAIIAMLIFGVIDAEMMDIRFHPFVLLIACAITKQEVKNEKVRI